MSYLNIFNNIKIPKKISNIYKKKTKKNRKSSQKTQMSQKIPSDLRKTTQNIQMSQKFRISLLEWLVPRFILFLCVCMCMSLEREVISKRAIVITVTRCDIQIRRTTTVVRGDGYCICIYKAQISAPAVKPPHKTSQYYNIKCIVCQQ